MNYVSRNSSAAQSPCESGGFCFGLFFQLAEATNLLANKFFIYL